MTIPTDALNKKEAHILKIEASEKPKVRNQKPKPKSNGKVDLYPSDQLDATELLRVLREVRNGDFSVRMPIDQVGMSGKICDILNEVIGMNQQMILEFTAARNTIGKQGNLTQRVDLPNAKGEWKTGVESINSLISDLVHPTIEIAHVISSVAKGNLSQKMPEAIGGHPL